jgi:hypothetical protein
MMVLSSFVKGRVSLLAPLLRSDAQGDILALLYLNPDVEFSIAELSRRTGAQLATIHREVIRLVESGIATDRHVGQARLIHANPDHPLAAPLAELVLLSYGPKAVLGPLVADLPGVRDAFIYGSWAARYNGQPGPAPRDVDVLIVGTTSQADLMTLGRTAEERLRREVNPTRVSPADWDAGTAPFVATVKAGPLVRIGGEAQ